MSEPKINIRPRFEFDSYAPVQGIVQDEEKEKTVAALFHWSIVYAAAICVALLGFVAMNWWIHGGFGLVWALFNKFAPWLVRVASTGQM
jgi:hypothetical protein